MRVALGAQAPALAVVDGPHRLLGLVDGVQGRVDGDRVAGSDQPLAVLQPLGDEAPVPGLLRKAREVAGDARARLLRRPGGSQEGAFAVRGVAHHHGEGGQDRSTRLKEVPVEIADQGVAAPARPDFREGARREHPHRYVRPVRVVEDEPRGRDRKGAAGRGALKVERVPRRPAPAGPVEPSVVLSFRVRGRQLRNERKERVRIDPPGLGPGRGKRPFERPPKPSERRLGRGPRLAREAGGQEHPAVLERERRSAFVERPPAGMGEERPAPRRHPRLNAARVLPRLGPVPDRRPVARTRPVDHLDHRALGRGIGQGARQRVQRPVVDPGEGWKLQQESATPGVQVEFAPLIPGPPGQEFRERRRECRKSPGLERVRPAEEVLEPLDHGTLHRAGSSTARTQWPSR